MKTIIAGSRDFNDYDLLEQECKKHLITKILCGCAKGSDELGKQYGYNNLIPVEFYPADWEVYGKRAGYLRNAEMANHAEACIVFWDGESKGTKHMIDIATKKGLDLTIIKYKEL